jgi:integral membrane protein
MPIGPRPADIPRVRKVLAVYRVSAIVTGVFLLLLCAMMVLRYGLGVDIELGGPFGFLALQPRALITAVDLSTAILIVHGWLYVVYLACDFLLWRFMRFSFGRFLFFALGGIVPLLSFYFEFRLPAYITARLDAAAASEADAPAAAGAAA